MLFQFLIKFLRFAFSFKKKNFRYKDQNISYLHYENSSKPTLVLIHGFSDIPDNFIRSCISLRKNFNIILPALKGFDDEGVIKGQRYSLEIYARQIIALLDSLQIGEFSLGGNSLGGAASLQIYGLIPSRIRKLILMDSAGFEFKEIDSIMHRLKRGERNPFLIETRSDFNQLFDQLFYHVPMETIPVKNYFFSKYKKGRLDYSELSQQLFSENQDKNFIIVPEKIAVETLIVWGAEDYFFPKEIAEKLHKLVPNSKLEVIPKVGHLPHIEKPFKLAKILKSHL